MHRHGWFFAALLLLCTLAFAPTEANAQVKQAGNFGIGLGFSNVAYPISMKYFLESDLSIQGTVGAWNRGWWGRYCYGRKGNCRGRRGFDDILGVGADLLYEGRPLAGNSSVSLSWEIGGGLGIGVGDGSYYDDDRSYDDGLFFGLNVAGVLGLQLNIDALPLDVVLEYRPNLLLTPGVDFDVLAAGFHVRYYF